MFGDLEVLTALGLSIKVGLACVLLGTLPAIAAGLWLARTEARWKALVTTLIFVPTVLPPAVTGFLLLDLFGRHGLFGDPLAAVGISLPFTFWGAVLAAIVVGFPLYVSASRAAFEAIDPELELTSQALGVPPWRTFLRITLPLASSGIVAGASLTFARTLGEFGATAIFAGSVEGETQTLSLAIYRLLDTTNGEQAARTLAWISVSMSLLAVIAHEVLVHRQRARLGRLRRGR